MSKKKEENIINHKILQQSHVNESVKSDDSKFNRVVPTMSAHEKLEMQEKEMSDSHAKMIETMDEQLDDDDDDHSVNSNKTTSNDF